MEQLILILLCVLIVYLGISLWWLGLSLNGRKQKSIEAKIKTLLEEYVQKYNIPVFYRERIITDGIECAGLYTYACTQEHIWKRAIRIELLNTAPIYTFAHEVGHDIAYREGLESTEDNADIKAYEFINKHLSFLEKQILSISLSCYFKVAYKEPSLKEQFYLYFHTLDRNIPAYQNISK